MQSLIRERRVSYAGYGTRELWVDGGGPTIVLVHGFGLPADTWRPVLELLAQTGMSAIAPDLPGFGEADLLADGDLLPQHDDFLAEVIRRHGRTNSVVVVGNSLGAALAARAGRNRDLPILGLASLDIAGIAWTRMLSCTLTPLTIASGVLAALKVPNLFHGKGAALVIEPVIYGNKAAVDRDVIRIVAGLAPDLPTAHRLLLQGRNFKRELDRVRDHGGVRPPMVVVHGAKDRLVPVSASRTLASANPDSRFMVIPHAGHCPQLDVPRTIVSLARELASISHRSSGPPADEACAETQ